MHSAIPVFDATYRSMNQHAKIDIRHSTCPHDCPSACALDVEVIDGSAIGRVRGYPNLYAAYGYGGNGITFSFLAARMIARMIAGKDEPWYTDLAVDRPKP